MIVEPRWWLDEVGLFSAEVWVGIYQVSDFDIALEDGDEDGFPIREHGFAVEHLDAFGSDLKHVSLMETPTALPLSVSSAGSPAVAVFAARSEGRPGPPTGTTMNHLALESCLSKSTIVSGRFR